MRRLLVMSMMCVVLAGVTACGNDEEKAATSSTVGSTATTVAPTTTSAAAPKAAVVTVGDNDDSVNARSVDAAVGQDVYIDLVACGGCGYEWRVDTQPAAAVATPQTVAQPTTTTASTMKGGGPLVGTPTMKRIAYRAVAAGTSTAKISYYGPAKTTADRTVVITINVK